MAGGKTLNAANLESLGVAQLAALLLEISTGNAPAKRRLRLALAGNAGAAEAARAVLKRLTSISRAKTWLGWQKIKPFVAELDAQRRAILDLVAPSEPVEAFELAWRLVGCAETVLSRSDDGSGRLAAAFQAAARDLGPLAQQADIHVEDLAARAFRVLSGNRHGVWDELIPILAPQLGPMGLSLLKVAMQAEAAGAQTLHRRQATRSVLQQIADARGDVDGYIEQIDARARRTPSIAVAIAERLVGAGRQAEAWAAVDAVEAGLRAEAPMEWDDMRTALLEAMGRADEAQEFRWSRFRATLNAGHLRAYLRKLPDFDDFDAEQRALAHAQGFVDVHRAMAFLVAWPDLRRLNELVLSRSRFLNGDLPEVLALAADALDAGHPLAATVLRRAMIEATLRLGRSPRYKLAARWLGECRDGAARVEDFGSLADHPTFERILRATHGRKAGFWQAVQALR